MPSRRDCANAIRALAIDAIEKAKSGHPGAPLGMADMAEALWRHGFRHNPADPAWADRDRFVLSNGHASMLLYAVLHLTGYDLPMAEIRNFRQWGSATPGHPERGLTPGVEMTTGPLGQGIASAVGMALAEAMLAAQFNRPEFAIVDHRTYAFCGEGCLMEGVSHEACALAAAWGLGKLTVLFDANGVSIDGKVDAWFCEDVGQRYAAYGWQVIGPVDGHDGAALDAALAEARADTERPALIICHTHIGFGSPKKDSAASHGAPLGADAAEATKRALGWTAPPFEVPDDIRAAWDAREEGRAREEAWNALFDAYRKAHPELAAEFARRMAGELPADWPEVSARLMAAAEGADAPEATRVASRKALEVLVPALPELVGGSADLSGSVGTQTKASTALDTATHAGNYLYYGVREFGMGAIMNGLALHGGFIPYAGTFMAFSDQARNALRLSSIMGLRVIWVLTHDSIGVGEDGATHQPVEQIPTLRMVPNLHVWRPCDDVETAVAWRSALECATTPTCLALSRQKLPQIPRDEAQVKAIARGGYVLRDCAGEPELLLMATGSETALAVEAAVTLNARGYRVRVISMPCAEVFDAQDEAWRESVLPGSVRCRMAVEAAAPGWWPAYVGLDGEIIGMKGFGMSAPGSVLFERFGFTADNVVERAVALLTRHGIEAR